MVQPSIRASVLLPVNIIAFILSVFPLLLERCNRRQVQGHAANVKKTSRLMRSVILSIAVYYVANLVNITACIACKMMALVMTYNYLIKIWFQGLFLLHRAHLVQGITPLLSAKWFSKILPRIYFGLNIIFALIFTKYVMDKDYVCVPYTDTGEVHFCAPHDSDESVSSVALGAMVNLLIVMFLIILFAVPLYRTVRVDIGTMNANQLTARKKLKRLLVWSVSMTLINQITSLAVVFVKIYPSEWAFALLRLDDVINVWTSWLMITRNRHFLVRILFRAQAAVKGRREESIPTLPTTFSEMNSSRRNNNLNSLKSKSQISVDEQIN